MFYLPFQLRLQTLNVSEFVSLNGFLISLMSRHKHSKVLFLLYYGLTIKIVDIK